MSLSPKQARFVEQYLLDLNAADAARRAGYSKRTAKQKGYELREMPKIQAAIAAAIQARSERTKVDQDWIVERLVENVERAMTVEPVMVGGKETGEYTYQGSVANKALELLGRHAGMFPNRHELTGKDGGPIKVGPDLSRLSKKELDALERILSRATGPG